MLRNVLGSWRSCAPSSRCCSALKTPPSGGCAPSRRRASARACADCRRFTSTLSVRSWMASRCAETLHTHTQRMSAVRANAIFVVLLCVAASMSTVALNWCCIACVLRCKSAAVSVHIRGDTRVGWRALYTVCRLYKGDTVQPRQRVRSGRSVLVHLTASHTAETPWRRRLPVVAFGGAERTDHTDMGPSHRAGA